MGGKRFINAPRPAGPEPMPEAYPARPRVPTLLQLLSGKDAMGMRMVSEKGARSPPR